MIRIKECLEIFLVQFVVPDVPDAYLSLAFLRRLLLSPNYFDVVDTRIYCWNWSPPAKALNTGAVIVLWLLTDSSVATIARALLVLTIKITAARRLARRTPPSPAPAPVGCAAAAVRSLAGHKP